MSKVMKRDFEYLGEYIHDELETRKKNRKSLDYQIKEIDRQIDMVPDVSHKLGMDGRRDPSLAWLPEVELPLQAEALETLTSDARSMQFPDSGPWFAAHAALTDDYLRKVDYSALLTGDEQEMPTRITQDNADKLAGGFITHLLRQYDFRGSMDQINAEAMSYGVGVGRARMVEKTVYRDTARGIVSDARKIPVLLPRSLKETYLDDRTHILMHEGYHVGPLTIFCRRVSLEDIQKQARGNNDPETEDGGWIQKNLAMVEEDKDGLVELIEAEGDFVIPRKTTGSLLLPGLVVTVVKGKRDKGVVRVQYRKHDFDSILAFPYHQERVGSPYATSPLRKGRPLQAAAVEALMRLVEASALNARPPIGYDRSDMWFAENGGPVVEPGALWATLGKIDVHQIGDVVALFNVYSGFLSQYADAVGVHRARLGAQTVSHTTAFAKNAELQRGAVRTVDYVRSTLQGPLTKWLHMCYTMGRSAFRGQQTMYIDAYRGFVTIGKDALPPMVIFEAHGSGGPQEEQEKRAMKIAALQQALQIDQLSIQLGNPPTIDLKSVIQEVLTEGGWTDTDPLLSRQQPQSQGQGGFMEAAQQQAMQQSMMEAQDAGAA